MPRLLLEGKSITELLARVRAEHGEDVTIVAAEKVRSGGIGGFFAKESYALTVEIDPDAGAEPGAAADASAPIVHSLMHERMDDLTGTNRAQNHQSLMHERFAGASGTLPRRDVEAPGTLLDLAAAIDAAEATENSVILATRPMHSTIQSPMLSTASPEFASILARLNALDAPLPDDAPEPGTTHGSTHGSTHGTELTREPAAEPELEAGTGARTETAASHGSEQDAYARLREALVEIAPHLDLQTSVPLVLVIPPAVLSPESAAAAPVVVAVPTPAAPPVETPGEAPVVEARAAVIPQQGRHRRAAVES